MLRLGSLTRATEPSGLKSTNWSGSRMLPFSSLKERMTLEGEKRSAQQGWESSELSGHTTSRGVLHPQVMLTSPFAKDALHQALSAL